MVGFSLFIEGNNWPGVMVTWSYIGIYVVVSLVLGGILWLGLTRRYERRPAAIGALSVVVSSFVIALVGSIYLDQTRGARISETIKGGDWPGVMIAASGTVLVDFILPILCYAYSFGIGTAVVTILLKNYRLKVNA